MANTIMTAKNSFEEGLIMDLSPDNTSANCMTSALNATLLTFNGNEMLLQNDMGNGRVETARLPDGYIPVGTCEFGDIVYIVSYNPLTDLSQIGCFPSPERNISSLEIYYNGQGGYQSLSANDFQELVNKEATGKIRNTSVKKVLIDNKKLNPGDKYIIYSTPAGISGNSTCLSDLLSDGKNLGYKNVKLHVVSIDESGKITELNSTTKWYDVYREDEGGNMINTGNLYYIDSLATNNINGNAVPDIDSYRNMLQSGWSIFSSKVSGKLAILAELETIKSFQCSYELKLIEKENDIEGKYKYKEFAITLYPDWETDTRDPSYILITKSEFNTSDKNKKDLTINNIESSTTYGYSPEKIIKVTDENGIVKTVKIPYKENIDGHWVDISSPNFVYNMEITPAMNYGILEHLSVNLEIDFNRVGKGSIKLLEWKYYNYGSTSMLQYNINIYQRPEYIVDCIIILFSDNKGLVGEYKLSGKKAYSGTHIEHFGLDGESYNSRFSRIDSFATDHGGGENVIKHPGLPATNITEISEADRDNYVNSNGTIHINDARTLYSGWLYKALIYVVQRHKQHPNFVKIEKCIERWYWTNSMFNSYFYLTKDFRDLNFELVLNGEALFETNPNYQWSQKEINNLDVEFNEGENHKTNSANIQYIGKNKVNNINMYMATALQNDYSSFKINEEDFDKIRLRIYLANAKLLYDLPSSLYEYSGNETDLTNTGVKYLKLENSEYKDSTISLDDNFKILDQPLDIINGGLKEGFNIYIDSEESEELKDDEGNEIGKAQYKSITVNKCHFTENSKVSMPLSMQAIIFNKAYVSNIYNTSVLVPVYTPIINSLSDLESLGIDYKIDANNYIRLAFASGLAINLYNNLFYGTALRYDNNTMSFIGALNDDINNVFSAENRIIDVTNDNDFINKVWQPSLDKLKLFFPVYLGGNGETSRYSAVMGSPTSYANVEKWQGYRSWVNNLHPDNHEVNSSLIIDETVFDISGNTISGVDGRNATNFLAMKYKGGMAVFNSAFVDSDTDGKTLNQKDRAYQDNSNLEPNSTRPAFYDNFAYQLYLILSNAYHKDKRESDKEVDMKNYVRNSESTIEMIKNIVIKLEENEEWEEHEKLEEHENENSDLNRPHDILIHNIKLSTILEGFDIDIGNIEPHTRIIENGEEDEEEINNTAGTANIRLKLLSFVKNHELKILLKSQPMSFLNTDIEAYILKNGLLCPCKNLSNSFYIYSDEHLLQYANKLLSFKYEDVQDNLNYLFADYKNSDYGCSLEGARRERTYLLSDYDNAYNYYLQLYFSYINESSFTNSYFMSEQEAINYKDNIINNSLLYSEGEMYGFTKLAILEDMKRDFINNAFTIREVTINGQYQWELVYNSQFYQDLLKKGSPSDSPYFKINTYFNLNSFKYENGLTLDSSAPFGSFGVVDNLYAKYPLCFGGFIRNIVIDTNYLMVQK